MKLNFKIIFFAICTAWSFHANGQQSLQKRACNNSVTPDSFFAIINFIVKELSLDTTVTLNTRISSVSESLSDSKYFKTLLIDSSRKFTIVNYDSLGNKVISRIVPNLNLLNRNDLKYLKCIRRSYENYKWDNTKLNFTAVKSNEFYSFSIPYYNLAHDMVIISFSYHDLSERWSQGRILLLRRQGNKWVIEQLEGWIT